MLQTHDLVLVEGGKPLPIPKVWCARPGEPDPPADVENIVATLAWDSERIEPCVQIVRDQLERAWKEAPIFGGVLIGGRSERMGQPKQTIEWKGRSFARIAANALTPQTERVLLLGDGPLPSDCVDILRLPDPPEVTGPLAGMLSAMRWAPDATWLFAAYDMPLISAEAIAWLCAQRRPGRWAVLPTLDGARPEPLLSVWEPMMRSTLEHHAHEGHLAPRLLKDHAKAEMIAVPAELQAAWKNINTPDDLNSLP
jgi:molybdopterin-guanine dinucleotide biosynthesis protein A